MFVSLSSCNISITFSISFLLIIIVATHCKNWYYPLGKRCSKTIQCESPSLFCINGTCQCYDKTKMSYYLDEFPSCRVDAGESCIVNKTSDDNAQKVPYLKELVCTRNALCQDGICQCKNSLKSGGRCASYQMYGHGFPCSEEGKCAPDLNLVCEKQVCNCNETEAAYDRNLGKCIGRVGASCNKYDKCVDYAHCNLNDTTGDKGTCQCRKGTVKGSNGHCYPALGYHCNSEPCLGDLICVNNKCSCPVNYYQVFNMSQEKCISKIYGPCSETFLNGKMYNFTCEPHLECRNYSGAMECSCPKGFIDSNEGICKPIFGSPCSGECDAFTNLQCINGKCDCEGLQEYDEKDQICRGLVGSVCDLHSSKNMCVRAASCQAKRDKNLPGICRCMKYFLATANRTCTLNVR